MTRAFARCGRASVALGTAMALGALVVSFAGLMHIVAIVLAEDSMGHGVRAVARAVALNPTADPWKVLRRELGLAESHSCAALGGNTAGTCDGWTLTIALAVSPGSLESALGGAAPSDGDMVLVRLWKGQGGTRAPDGIGLARSEPEA